MLKKKEILGSLGSFSLQDKIDAVLFFFLFRTTIMRRSAFTSHIEVCVCVLCVFVNEAIGGHTRGDNTQILFPFYSLVHKCDLCRKVCPTFISLFNQCEALLHEPLLFLGQLQPNPQAAVTGATRLFHQSFSVERPAGVAGDERIKKVN